MKYIFGIALIITSFNVNAAGDDHCDSVLEHGARNFVASMDFDSQLSYVYSKACNDQYYNSSGSTQLGIEAVIKKVPIGINFGSSNKKTSMRKWCSENDSKYSSTTVSTYNENKVYGPAVDAWLNCKNAYAAGLKVKTEISANNRSLAFHVTNDTTDREVILRGINISPSTVVCKALTDTETVDADLGTRLPLFPKQSLTLNCTRQEESISRDGQNINVVQEASITINTKLKNYQISLPELSVITLTDIRANQIESELKKINTRVSNLGSKDCAWSGWVNKAPLSNSISCPAGKYVRTINMKHAAGAPWWTEDVRVECCGL